MFHFLPCPARLVPQESHHHRHSKATRRALHLSVLNLSGTEANCCFLGEIWWDFICSNGFSYVQGSKLPWNENGWAIHFQWYGNNKSLDPGTYDFQCFSYTTFQKNGLFGPPVQSIKLLLQTTCKTSTLIHLDGCMHAMLQWFDNLTSDLGVPANACESQVPRVHPRASEPAPVPSGIGESHLERLPWPLRITRLETIFRNRTALQSCAGKAHCTVLDLKSRTQLNNTRYEKIRKDTKRYEKIRKDTKRYEHSCTAFKFNFHSKANTLRQPTYLLLISECMGLQQSNSWNQKLTCDIG